MERPYVIIGGYMSIDGKIAPKNRKGLLFTSFMEKELMMRLHALRSRVDAILVGINTILADNPRLTVREVKGNNPLRIVLDSEARVPLDSNVMNILSAPTLIAVSDSALEEKVKTIEEKGVTVLRCGKRQVDVRRLLRLLKKMGINRVLVEGGGEVRWSFLEKGFADELFLCVMLSIWGGRDAPTLVDGEGFDRSDDAIQLDLMKMETIGRNIVLRFRVEDRLTNSRNRIM